jgi:hypothetical protein
VRRRREASKTRAELPERARNIMLLLIIIMFYFARY